MPHMLMCFLRDGIVKRAGIQTQDRFNRAVILRARDGVRFVMIHVAGGDDQNWTVLRRNDVGDCDSELFESSKLRRAHRDRNEFEMGLKALQEGQLDFDSMLIAMSG